ncbi:hypothetical protein [Asticcacaulis sp. 201]|uniref:hypothetical protein n=1 Tax=Asticcacaulis sp. 201 TaxID=3028787 RepID=UPI0029161C24|nr:hypothetical protein [Asticcacaulis sp. 201]MDV6331543.1 hypothetical protein [Asticcacaulis sp. 201]
MAFDRKYIGKQGYSGGYEKTRFLPHLWLRCLETAWRGFAMRFSGPVMAPEGLTSYVKVRRIQPVQILLNIIEGLFGLVGVAVLILFVWLGSFEKAGSAVDQGVSYVKTGIEKLIVRR